jgi:hypothetical protein
MAVVRILCFISQMQRSGDLHMAYQTFKKLRILWQQRCNILGGSADRRRLQVHSH